MAPFDFAPLARRYAQDEWGAMSWRPLVLGPSTRLRPGVREAKMDMKLWSMIGGKMAPFDFAPLARRYAQDEWVPGR